MNFEPDGAGEAREEDMTTTTTKWLTVPEVAERLRMDASDIYRLIKSGQLKAKKISERRTRVSERDLEEFMEGRPSAD